MRLIALRYPVYSVAVTLCVLHVSLRGGSRLCVAVQAWVIQIPPERVIIRTFATRAVTTYYQCLRTASNMCRNKRVSRNTQQSARPFLSIYSSYSRHQLQSICDYVNVIGKHPILQITRKFGIGYLINIIDAKNLLIESMYE